MNAAIWFHRPIAHRGLHDRAQGVIENTPSAFHAAIAAGYAIETDLQEAADGEAMVFHDSTLGRLTMASGSIHARPSAELRAIPFKETGDTMPSLPELLALTEGRVPLFLELKSAWHGATTLAERVAACLAGYPGPAAVMSFDPTLLAAFRSHDPQRPRGLVAMRFTAADWPHLSRWRRFRLTHLLESPAAKPHFIAYDIRALPALAPWTARRIARRPLLTWTIRTASQRRKALACADAIIFEGFRP